MKYALLIVLSMCIGSLHAMENRDNRGRLAAELQPLTDALQESMKYYMQVINQNTYTTKAVDILTPWIQCLTQKEKETKIVSKVALGTTGIISVIMCYKVLGMLWSSNDDYHTSPMPRSAQPEITQGQSGDDKKVVNIINVYSGTASSPQ
jgi:hypothetical protein